MIIFLEGNLGSGKTTLSKRLSVNKNLSEMVKVYDEKDHFTKFKHHNPLKMFYENKIDGYTFQNFVFDEFTKLINGLNNNCVNIITRSPRSAFHVFCDNLYENKMISEIQYDLLFERFENIIIKDNAYYIYLEAEVDKCKERLLTRNKETDAIINSNLLYNVDKFYKLMMNKSDTTIINTNENTPDQVEEQFYNTMKQLAPNAYKQMFKTNNN